MKETTIHKGTSLCPCHSDNKINKGRTNICKSISLHQIVLKGTPRRILNPNSIPAAPRHCVAVKEWTRAALQTDVGTRVVHNSVSFKDAIALSVQNHASALQHKKKPEKSGEAKCCVVRLCVLKRCVVRLCVEKRCVVRLCLVKGCDCTYFIAESTFSDDEQREQREPHDPHHSVRNVRCTAH